MPVLCFVLDTSASMNRRTAQGQRVIDLAKTAIDNFLKKVRAKEPSARTDQYLLLTTDREQTVRVGPKDSPTIFWRELHNLQADDASDVGYAITTAFDILNMERFDHELDSIGRGRQPWSIRPSAVIVLSDGGMLTNKSLTRTDLELPGSSLPGSALITEPFRWDQRVYSLCLRLDGHGSGDQVDRSDEHVVHGSDPLAALCEVTGGKSYQVAHPAAVMETLQAINGELQTSDRAGIVMNFEKVNDRINARPELANGPATDQKWHKTQQIVYVRTKYTTGSFLGFWPIPESYFPDPDAEKLPPRSAQPVLKFTTRDVKFRCLPNFAFDKLELQKGPLVDAMLSRNRPESAWQVFVENSGSIPGMDRPIGYLKPNSSNEVVHLFLHPYDYEAALTLIDELFQSKMNPSQVWKTQWTAYLREIPRYYIPHLRKSLAAVGGPPGIVPEGFELKLPQQVDSNLKKIKSKLRVRVEEVIENLRLYRERVALNSGKLIPLKELTFGPEKENSEYSNFCLVEKHKTGPKQPLLEPFDVDKTDILNQLERMRAAFKQCLMGGVPLHHEALLHEIPQANMGNFAEYEKKRTKHVLRDPFEDDSASKKLHGFGNPFKPKNGLIDVEDRFDFNEGSGPTRNKRSARGLRDEQTKRRRKRNLSFRNRGKSYDSGLHSDSDSDMSDSSSINGAFSEDENGRHLTNGFHEDNGFNKQSHKRKNGMVNGYGNDHHKPKSSRRVPVTPAALHDEKVYTFCRPLIRRMGRDNEVKFVEELLKLKAVDVQTRLITIRKLQRDALNFSRQSMFQILEQFLAATEST